MAWRQVERRKTDTSGLRMRVCGKREAAAGRVLCEHCASVSNAAKAAYKERLKKQAVKEENREPRYSISDVLQMYPDLTYGKAVAVLEGHGRFS